MRFLFLIIFTAFIVGCSPDNDSNVDEAEGINAEEGIEEDLEEEVGTGEQRKEEHKTLTTEEQIEKISENVLVLLKEQQFHILAEYVDPDHGLRFSPYAYMNEDDITFSKEEVLQFLSDDTVYKWGVYDGKGDPIELTTKEYYKRFIFDQDFTESDEVVFNEIKGRGNTIKNIHEVYPDAKFIEFYKEGTEEYSGMDWRSLNLVYKEGEGGNWYLIALVHDEWTI